MRRQEKVRSSRNYTRLDARKFLASPAASNLKFFRVSSIPTSLRFWNDGPSRRLWMYMPKQTPRVRHCLPNYGSEQRSEKITSTIALASSEAERPQFIQLYQMLLELT